MELDERAAFVRFQHHAHHDFAGNAGRLSFAACGIDDLCFVAERSTGCSLTVSSGSIYTPLYYPNGKLFAKD